MAIYGQVLKMYSLARSNKYLNLNPHSFMKIVRENVSTSTAFERVPAKARDGAVIYKSARSLAASKKKRAKSSYF